MNIHNIKQLNRSAFTIIEILVSVVILSGALLYVLQVHTTNQKQIVYLSERNKLSLQDSLFASKNVLRYHKSTKSSYDLLNRYFKVSDLKSRTILKKASRTFFIPKQFKIMPPPDVRGPTALVDEINMKGDYSSYYFHFKVVSF